MKTAHTPGPWWVMESGVRDVGGYICHTNAPTHFPGQDERYANEIEERKKNKILIAAAPDLLDALKDAYPYIDNDHLRTRTGNLIAIATGGQA